jgi:hypothetical protein
MIESFSDVILIAKILLAFLSRIDWETLSKFYQFGKLPNHDTNRGDISSAALQRCSQRESQ